MLFICRFGDLQMAMCHSGFVFISTNETRFSKKPSVLWLLLCQTDFHLKGLRDVTAAFILWFGWGNQSIIYYIRKYFFSFIITVNQYASVCMNLICILCKFATVCCLCWCFWGFCILSSSSFLPNELQVSYDGHNNTEDCVYYISDLLVRSWSFWM